MGITPCPSLAHLGVLLQDMYDLRSDAERDKDSHALFLVEHDLGRAHRLVGRHRKLCSQCKFNDAVQKLPDEATTHHSNVVPINRTN